jgi:DNA-binding response OmpR family regulator
MSLPESRRFVDRIAVSCPPSVLLVDDEVAVRAAMSRFFVRNGWTVYEASEGAAATCLLDPIAGNAFDLVICDLRMPNFSGSDLYRWLSNHRPDVVARLVFSSGDLQSPESMEFLREAERPVLPKPFDLGELRRIVDEVVRSAHAA